jgi:hypothetical protein
MSGQKIIEALEEAVAASPVPTPVKVWRNWFRVKWRLFGMTTLRCSDCGAHIARNGQTGTAWCSSFPTKDLAETRAAEDLARQDARYVTYLGAFPDGEHP